MKTEVTQLIDKALNLCAGKQIVAASEMMDILLDIRLMLSSDEIKELAEEPVGAT
jgi:hypothetical protein